MTLITFQVFYVDFLKLVKDYGLTQVEIPKIYSEKSDIQKAATKNRYVESNTSNSEYFSLVSIIF